MRAAARLAAGQRAPGEVLGAAHGAGQHAGAEVHDLRTRGPHDLGAQSFRLLLDAVDGAQPVGDPPHAGPSLLHDGDGPAGQRGVGPVDGAEGDVLLADLFGAGDAQYGDGLALAREAVRGHRGGVLVAQPEAGLGERLADGGGVGADAVFAAVGEEDHGAFGADRQFHAVPLDPAGAGGRQVGALGADAELAERLGDGACGGPHRAAVAVDGEHDRSSVPYDDLVAAGQLGAGGGRDDVVGPDAEVLVGQQVVDVVGEGVQGARGAVDGEPDGLVVRDEGGGAAGEEGDDHGPGQQPAQRFGVCGAAPATAARGAVGAW